MDDASFPTAVITIVPQPPSGAAEGGPQTPPSGWPRRSAPPPTVPAATHLPPPQSETGSWEDPGATADRSGPPARGELGIKERRSWKTWQLVTACIVMALVGMVIGNAGSGSSGSASSSATKTYKLPPPSSSGGPGSSATPTTNPSPSTTAPSSTAATVPTTAPVTGTTSVLVPRFQSQGNWTSPTFTVAGGTWNIGWAYQCTPVPSGGAAFQVFVVTPGAAPGGTPAITQTPGSGQGITPVTSPGAQQIIVQAPSGCQWVVKVTGVAG